MPGRNYFCKRRRIGLGEKRYTDDGYLVITETDQCPLWEKTTMPCSMGCTNDCFYCKYSDFRTPEFIAKVENEPRTGKWHSVCHNEKTKKQQKVEAV
jgi:hypothetical protein